MMPLSKDDANTSGLQEQKILSTQNPENNSIALKLPPFWPNSPATWFIQAEAQFQISRINSETSRYNYILASLPQDIIESILDFVQNPPPNDIYKNIKELLIERHSLSLEKRIEQIISTESMGDRKPSDFYRSLKQLAGVSNTIGDELIRKLWARRLPQSIYVALISHSEKSISDILPIADQIWEATQISQVSNIISASNQSTNHLYSLEKDISEIKKLLSNLHLPQSRSRNLSRNRNHSRSNSRIRSNNRLNSNSNNKICWYHKKFSNKAQKCIKPCAFTLTNNTKN